MKVALAAALLLILQMAAQSVTLVTSLSMAGIDVFGNPLCLASTDRPASGTDSDRHDKHNACCTLACSAPANTLGAPPDRPVLLLVQNTGAVSAAIQAGRLFVPAFEHRPGNPRAPPLTV